MKVDAQLKATSIAGIQSSATDFEKDGYDGVWTAETNHDPFLPAVLAAARTDCVEVGTGIAVAFARNPMSMAYSGHDLQVLSRGRFILGIGSQVKAHIERRFSMPWSNPAARMRDFILAMQSIWASWNTEAPLDHQLDYEGEFYRHSLMSPLFRPAPSPWGPPKVHLAGVGDLMIGVAGELAAGLIVHSFGSERSLRERTLPILGRSLSQAGRVRSDVEVSLPLLVATGPDGGSIEQAVGRVRAQIAFYASTPTYRWILGLHGWDEVGEQLTALSRKGKPEVWSAMAALVDDDMVEAFAVVGPPGELAAAIRSRYSGLVDRISLYTPYRIEAALIAEIAQDVRLEPMRR